MAGHKLVELFREHTGLVIVDMQVEGCEGYGPGFVPVIRNIRSLLDRYRKANEKVIHGHRFAPLE